MKKLIIPIGILFLSNLTYAQLSQLPNTENYVQTKTYLDYNGTSATKSSETVQYFDGLGRSKQIVNVKASPLGRDVVTPIEYDPFGRKVKDYLPVPQGGTLNGAITPNPLSNVSGTPYGSEKIYSEKILENSPLNRIQQQIQVGTDWSNKSVKFEYNANGFNEVYQFTTSTTWVDGATKSVVNLSPATVYASNQLYKSSVKDEDENETIEFKNGKGQVVLVRKVKSSTEHIDTYYVYNEYDQLAFVIPPMAVHKPITDDLLNTLCYQYRYDGRGRLVEKRLPGKGWEYILYDRQDRAVGTQDAELRKKGQWLYTKYDQFGRVAFTGISEGGTRSSEQALVNNFPSNNVKRTNFPFFNREGMDVFYDPDQTYPNVVWIKLLSVNYYDTYPAYGFNPPFPSSIQGEPLLTENPTADGRSTKGFPVVSFVKNIEDDNWTKNYTYYDQKGRVIGSHSINHLGGYTHIESKLDFAGLPKQTITRHKRLDSDTERTITETFDYDNQNRLLVHKHQIDSNPVEYLTQNKYNELSQLESKKVGGVTASSPLQQMDYKYNIRGWMTQINDPANLGSDLFGYKINYNKVEGLEVPNGDYPNQKVKPKYNGNIAEVSWKTLTEDNEPLKRYGYAYDPLNRLTAGFYQNDTNPYAKEYNELLAYDVNGNILNLVRTQGLLPGANTTLMIDNLKYDYVGNKLVKVTDQQQNPSGYPYSSTPNMIGYDNDTGDGNGNMISQPDKGISSIQYNYLNLPKQITQNSNITQYTYRADGAKVKKLFKNLETHYLDGFQYKSTFGIESWDGQGIYQPDPNEVPELKLRIIPTSEGYYDALLNRYVYNFTDHLGNVRLSYTDISGDGIIQPRRYNASSCTKWFCIDDWKPGEIVEVNNYYPFGMLHDYTTTKQNAYQYKYNGKELQETGMYDYGARFYMSDLGRWGTIDNKAEKYISASPYHYAGNNPILYFDIDGNEFTDDALEWVNKLIANAREKRANNNYEISKYQEMIHNGGSEKEMKNWQKKIDKYSSSNNELDKTIAEINVMASSNQVYDVFENSNDLSDSFSKVGGFGFNFNNGYAYIILPSGADIAMFSHELKHGYQFEIGETGSVTKSEQKNGVVFLHDRTDEVAGYQRGMLFGQNDSYTTNSLPSLYDGLPTGPINTTNYPAISQALRLPINQQKSALQNIANQGKAFRVNGQTYYKK